VRVPRMGELCATESGLSLIVRAEGAWRRAVEYRNRGCESTSDKRPGSVGGTKILARAKLDSPSWDIRSGS
jgi:hypothetical protein